MVDPTRVVPFATFPFAVTSICPFVTNAFFLRCLLFWFLPVVVGLFLFTPINVENIGRCQFLRLSRPLIVTISMSGHMNCSTYLLWKVIVEVRFAQSECVCV